MDIRIRSGRSDDLASIVAWTTDTFTWGDYIPDRLHGWLEDDDGEVLVCADSSDRVLALAHAKMLSANEGWLEAARVHPEHRRSGLGKALNHAGVEWCKQRGAQVVRLAAEDDNVAAIGQVEGLGYRRTSSWLFASWAPADVGPRASGTNLSPAAAQDADAAWVFWSTSELAVAGRGLWSERWRWRKAHAEDLAAAARSGALYGSPAGWAAVTEVEHDKEHLRVDWAATTKHEAPALLSDLLGLAASRETGLYVRLPNVDWIRESLTRAGAEPTVILVFAKSV